MVSTKSEGDGDKRSLTGKWASSPWNIAARLKKRETSRGTTPLSRIPPVYTKASVLLPKEYAKNPTVHKVHILGADERSRFIAHALSSVYDSVEILRWTDRHKYNNIHIQDKDRNMSRFGPMPSSVVASNPRDESHIDHLVVGGSANFAASELAKMKHRLDQDSTVCLMNDGLGVLEEVRRSVFEGTHKTPKFIMGHMDHKLVFNSKHNSLKRLKPGQLLLTVPEGSTRWARREVAERKVQTRSNLVKSLSTPAHLYTRPTNWDTWFRFKLPSVLFASIVDPICIALGVNYAGLLRNRSAERMIHQLCVEMIDVMRVLPELQNCSAVQGFLDIETMCLTMHRAIVAKQAAPCQLDRKLRLGKRSDADYLNGYFLQKAKVVGVDMKLNKMMLDMVKAKQQINRDTLDQEIPFDVTTVPPDWDGHTVMDGPSNFGQAGMRRWPSNTE